jgi:hypothetical protein
MEIPTLSAAATPKAGAYDEVEEPICIVLSRKLATWEGRGRFKKRFASTGIFCLTLKGMLF